MDIQEVLSFVDELVFTKTGKHLSNLQVAILREVWQGQKYFEIAEENYCSEGYVRNLASELWQILSNAMAENVNRTNFRSVMERKQSLIVSSNFFGSVGNDLIISNVNVCRDISSDISSPSKSDKLQQNLSTAPDLVKLSDRQKEIANLEKWILREGCRLIAILGNSGIGKTALACYLLQKIKTNFDVVIWLDLNLSPPLENTLKSLILSTGNQTEDRLPSTLGEKLSILLSNLQKKRCLIVLDDVQTLLREKQLAGNYQSEYRSYKKFFKLIGETVHKSCFIINSWESPQEIITLAGKNSPVSLFPLKPLGLGASEILRENKLLDESEWEKLINIYQGNPLWLKIAVNTIQEIFGGRVGEFFKYEQLYISEELAIILEKHWQRLSEIEQKVITCLSQKMEPLSIAQLLTDSQLSAQELFNAIKSLGRRFLIETKMQEQETLFSVLPIFRQYVISNFEDLEKLH
ncbi:MAG: NACHT domain-containing protein [Okeania sp. SIO2F4]|uniref:NB-ARC domain-containing protein n=1 Tax=Okeania sp. SIO2F4 TaxID=2607790 RepID=UPI0014299159|nr:NB-ARC domain-containing protein [Okeania sp. SIO2F4]NES07556.1 NACHT domain-containing protein [Okeania sp. SIO2F4]